MALPAAFFFNHSDYASVLNVKSQPNSGYNNGQAESIKRVKKEESLI